MMNLFEQAIEKNELLDFAIGKQKYYVIDREYGEHSVIGAWLNYVLPLIEIKGVVYVNQGIESMFKRIIQSSEITEQSKNENLLYHLHTYYYLDSENRIKAFLSKELSELIEKTLAAYLDKLKNTNDTKYPAFANAMNLIKSRGGLITKSI